MSYFNRSNDNGGINHPLPSHNHVGEYQQSSIPYVTASHATTNGEEFEFPYVTRFLVITNDTGADIKVGFTANGLAAAPNPTKDARTENYMIIPTGVVTDRLEVKCKSVFVKGTFSSGNKFSILAGLTNVPARTFPILSGSTGVEGIG